MKPFNNSMRLDRIKSMRNASFSSDRRYDETMYIAKRSESPTENLENRVTNKKIPNKI